MTEVNDMIRHQAIAWVIRTRDADFADWEAFTRWLEEDPQHNIVYEQALSAEDRFVDLAKTINRVPDDGSKVPLPANDTLDLPGSVTNRRRMMFGALAASLVVAVSAGIWTQMPQPYDVVTGPGERQVVSLPDGSQITINGDSRITLDNKKPRHAVLDRGEALFTVTHKDGDPFIVDTGNARLVDAGTEFNVVKDDETLDVAVSEGLVIYNPARENISLPAGKRLHRDTTINRVTVSNIAIGQIGTWRTGRLSFTGATLAQVTDALQRNLGVSISVTEAIAGQPFSGVIQLKDRDPENLEPIAALLGVSVEKQDKGWILTGDDAVP
ncbi:FecR domain-containing protein [Sphingorhabdus sp. Alg231-15]|uniref:FecR domain-containing protein n=1 Tax=Sphingorhabdus sp. Alg231-15 TaxID=1922222 RepID=UPI000D5602D4